MAGSVLDELERLRLQAEEALLFCAGDSGLSNNHRSLLELKNTLSKNSSDTDTLAAIRGALASSSSATTSAEYLKSLEEHLKGGNVSTAVLTAACVAAKDVVTHELNGVIARAKARIEVSEGSTSADSPLPLEKPPKLNRVLHL